MGQIEIEPRWGLLALLHVVAGGLALAIAVRIPAQDDIDMLTFQRDLGRGNIEQLQRRNDRQGETIRELQRAQLDRTPDDYPLPPLSPEAVAKLAQAREPEPEPEPEPKPLERDPQTGQFLPREED